MILRVMFFPLVTVFDMFETPLCRFLWGETDLCLVSHKRTWKPTFQS